MDLTSGEGGATSGNVTVASADGKSTGQVSLETGAASGAERKTAEAAAGYLAISCFDYPQAAGVISFRNEGVSLVVDSVAQTHHFLSTLVHPGPVRPLREPDPRGQKQGIVCACDRLETGFLVMDTQDEWLSRCISSNEPMQVPCLSSYSKYS